MGHDTHADALVLPLEACTQSAAPYVGGKALGLGALIAAGLNVPRGFAITTEAYRRAATRAGITDAIAAALADVTGDSDPTDASERISSLFRTAMVDSELRDAIGDAYDQLGRPAVAVRSSAVAEDRADASFAGQQDTYLWVEGLDDVISRLVDCWASLFSPRVLTYRSRLDVAAEDVAMAVVVQTMVPARAAGVMMTLDPVDGDRDTIYIESSYGLGEAVVAGEVSPDAFWISKSELAVRRSTIGEKQIAHRFDAARGEVRRFDVDSKAREQLSLSDAEVQLLAQLGQAVEKSFGRPMDIEWAIADREEGPSQIDVLQARPETVWSNRPAPGPGQAAATPAAGSQKIDTITVESWDPLHAPSAPDLHWSTSNLGEAMPGVMTPLGWTLWHRPLERAALEGARRMGVFSRDEAKVGDDVGSHYFRAFFGRPAVQIEYFAAIGDRMPGTSAEQTITSVVGRVPDGFRSNPTLRRAPVVAWRLPLMFLTAAREIRQAAASVDAWYPAHLEHVATANTVPEAARLFREAATCFEKALATQVTGTLGGIMPVYDALERLVAHRGIGDVGKLSGFGGAEVSGLVTDLWRASRGEISVDEAVARLGFHGPMEGEISSTVWREDPQPVLDLVAAYARQDGDDDPRLRAAEHQAAAHQVASELLAATPAWQRPGTRLLLKLAAERIPLRGVAKRALIQALDGARAAARRLGELYVDAGTLDQTDEIFFLTAAEVTSLPADVKALVGRRRERRAMYETVAPPSEWKGAPKPVPHTTASAGEGGDVALVEGVGVSAGVVEGHARVLHQPDFASVVPGEILVTPTTDPSWSSVMQLSAALVVDIGGALSHAAVVAREMGLPCVVNTRTGTGAIRSGDRIRVDGSAGVVEILERAPSDADARDVAASTAGDQT